MNNLFEIKVLLRRAKCYVIKNEIFKVQKDIESIEQFSISQSKSFKISKRNKR